LMAGELAVIDPGGERKKLFLNKKLNANVVIIINTHGHFDHTLADNEIKKNTGAPIAIAEADKRQSKGIEPDLFLRDGDKIKVGGIILEVIATPGHTKGSICLLSNGFLFSGDTIFDNAVGRTDLEGGSDDEMKKSLAKLDKLIPEGTIVYPGHGKEFKFKKGIANLWI